MGNKDIALKKLTTILEKGKGFDRIQALNVIQYLDKADLTKLKPSLDAILKVQKLNYEVNLVKYALNRLVVK
jgi:hypothetical protein